MRTLAVVPFALVALATACADREVTAPTRAAAGAPKFTLSPTSDRTFVYVANTGSNTVSVIQTSTNSVVATIGVGVNPRGVAIAPSGGRVYVSNRTSDNVSVIRTSDNTVVATIPVGQDPEDIAVASDGGRVFVLNTTDGSVSVIRTTDNTVVTTLDLGDNARTLTITPDGTELFVTYGVRTSSGLGTITVHHTSAIRTSDYTVRTDESWLLGSPINIVITRDGARAYTPFFAGLPPAASLRVLRTSDFESVASLSLGGLDAPGHVALTPSEAYAYLVDPGSLSFSGTCISGSVRIIPTATLTIEATVPVNCFPREIAFSLDGAIAYVTSSVVGGAGSVTRISTTQKAVVGSVAVGSSPNGLAVGFVPTSAQIMDELEDALTSLGLPSGFEGSLLTKLASARTAIQAGKIRGACGALQDFVSQLNAQSDKKIAAADATTLIGLANQLRELIGC